MCIMQSVQFESIAFTIENNSKPLWQTVLLYAFITFLFNLSSFYVF